MFTEDGEITYGATQSILHAWGPSNAIIRAIILAFLTTILSYQATATIIDLAFGTKRFGFARVRDIQLLLLIRRQSPYAVARSLFKRLPFSTLPNYDSRDPPGRLRPSVVAKLLLLLLVAPVVNIAAIFLTLEFETDFTYKQIEFGGIAIGIEMNSTRQAYTPVSKACVRAPVSVGRAEIALAEFAICDSVVDSLNTILEDEATVSVRAVAGNAVHVVIKLPFLTAAFFSVGHIINNDPQLDFPDRYNFRVAHAARNESASALADMIMGGVRELCGGGEVGIKEPQETEQKLDISIDLKVPCDVGDTEEVREVLENLIEEARTKIVFVHSDQLNVMRDEDTNADDEDPEFISADNEKFLRRRNTYADIFIMFIFVAAMVFVRVFTRWLTRNDVPRGIGLIIRDELGLPCCDSMLPNRDVVATYSGLAHVGVRHREDEG